MTLQENGTINGNWHPEGRAARHDARLTLSNDFYQLEIQGGTNYHGEIADLHISDRLGNIERKLTLEDGSVFITPDNDAVDRLLKRSKSISGFIHRIETSMPWVLAGVLVIALSTFGFFKWGVPWASEKIAHALPHKTNELIARNTLKFLDKYVFSKSALDEVRKKQIRSHFSTRLVPLASRSKNIKYKLHFRNWPGIPNAFALPSGDIILTDKFVQLCANQDEMDSVILHEVGHVERRHGLETLIEGTFITVSVMLIVGDINFLGDMGVGLGSMLVSTSYSRSHESEADEFAFKKMLVSGIDPASFSKIMNRMTKHIKTLSHKSGKKTTDQKSTVSPPNKKIKIGDGKRSWWDYLSSHPETSHRVNVANQYSACFKRGLTTCQISPER